MESFRPKIWTECLTRVTGHPLGPAKIQANVTSPGGYVLSIAASFLASAKTASAAANIKTALIPNITLSVFIAIPVSELRI